MCLDCAPWELYFIFLAAPFYLLMAITFCAVGAVNSFNRALMKRAAEWIDPKLFKVWDYSPAETVKLIAPAGHGLFGLGLGLVLLLIVMAVLFLLPKVGRRLVASLLALMIVIHLVMIGVYFSKGSSTMLVNRDILENQVRHFISTSKGDDVSEFQTAFMKTYQCCGYQNGSDFTMVGTAFSKSDRMDGHVYKDLNYPISCCRGAPSSVPKACPMEFTAENSFIQVGCEQASYGMLKKWTDRIVLLTLFLLLVNWLQSDQEEIPQILTEFSSIGEVIELEKCEFILLFPCIVCVIAFRETHGGHV